MGEGDPQHLQTLRSLVQTREAALWTQQTECLGLERAWGKMYFRLAWEASGSLRCQVIRSELQAASPKRDPSRKNLLQKLHHAPPSSVEGWRLLPQWKQEQKTRQTLCFSPCQMSWPAPPAGRATTFSFLLQRAM